MLAGGNPVLLSVWVNLEDMSSGAEDGLFPEGQREEVINLICTYYHSTQAICQLCPFGCTQATLHEKPCLTTSASVAAQSRLVCQYIYASKMQVF